MPELRNELEDSLKSLNEIIAKVRKAQEAYSKFTQEQVDKIFRAAAKKANEERLSLAKAAVEETRMGLFEDKVIKNHYAAEYIYNAYKNTKTCGIIEDDDLYGTMTIAEPVGVVAAVIPTTNPTSTAIFKALLCLKTRNGVVISPHPRAKKCTVLAAKTILEAAIEAGAPKDIIAWLDEPTKEKSAHLMKEADLILATGGSAMVKAAYSSGKPAIGVGAGNTPAVFDESADIKLAVSSVILSKTFDNGVICASEQSVIVAAKIYDEVKEEFAFRGGYFLNESESEKIRALLFENGGLNPTIVGQTAREIAKRAGFTVPQETKVLIAEIERTGKSEVLSGEKLCPVLSMYKSKSTEDAFEKAQALVLGGGIGHTAAIYLDERKRADVLDAFALKMKACRILVNSPSSQGGIGDLYNFALSPSLTLGCGSWGGNSVSENVGVMHLLNIKTVAKRRENMLWFRAPEKIYFKKGCLPFAVRELAQIGKKRAFIVTDNFLYSEGHLSKLMKSLEENSFEYTCFHEVEPDPTLKSAVNGAKQMSAFSPDVIIAFGGGSAMDAGKIMWLLYEHPDTDFSLMAMRFQDIRKRIFTFPKMGQKALFAAVPTSAGTGSEVTPFAVITDEKTSVKYPIADYELMPSMAVIDSDFQLSAPKSLTAASGIDAVTHAIEAYVSMLASDFTNSLAVGSLKLMFEYLPLAFENGDNLLAREKTANAASMAGMAFANSFLGLCHSMAHKLGSFHHLPHGIANALLICEVIRFNSTEIPEKMGTFPQYAYPDAKRRYACLAKELGCGGKTDDESVAALIQKIEELKTTLGIKDSIKAYGIKENDFLFSLDEMTLEAFDDQCTGANPRYPLRSEIRQIYLNAYYGTHAE
ncbi:MAG: bifunctional acetaldehyde-CoA/alcohol dehydrogenase [Acutalibacteraceae bacterium]